MYKVEKIGFFIVVTSYRNGAQYQMLPKDASYKIIGDTVLITNIKEGKSVFSIPISTLDGPTGPLFSAVEVHAYFRTIFGESDQSTTVTTAVDSVNGFTGIVVLDTDDINEGVTNFYYTDARVAANAAVALNTAKVTNAIHTGDVTGDTVLTIAAGAVDISMLSAGGTPDGTTFLRGDNTWAVPAVTESTHLQVKNTSGSLIAKGTPVYITGNVGGTDKLEIAPADASSASTMPAVGLLEADLANNGEGFVVQGGFLKGLVTATIDGTSTSSNDTVYVKSGGGLTMTKPTGASNFIQNIAKVARVHASNGSLVVSSILRANDVPNITQDQLWLGNSSGVATPTDHTVENISNVTVSSKTDGQALVWDAANNYWKNGTVSGGAYEETVTQTAHGITLTNGLAAVAYLQDGTNNVSQTNSLDASLAPDFWVIAVPNANEYTRIRSGEFVISGIDAFMGSNRNIFLQDDGSIGPTVGQSSIPIGTLLGGGDRVYFYNPLKYLI